MVKMSWAKGRQRLNKNVACDPETRELARKLALENGVTIKEMISMALTAWEKEYAARKDFQISL